jgi:hypothetical protein
VKKKNAFRAQEEMLREISTLWPAIKGSLARVKKPCIRPACRSCARGKKHPAWLLSFTLGSWRRCMYVPIGLVPQLKRAMKNGRRIEKLLYRMGAMLIREYRAEHPGGKSGKTRAKRSKSAVSKKNPCRKS